MNVFNRIKSGTLASTALFVMAIGFTEYTGIAYGDGLDSALVEARREKSNPSLNLLTYRHLDELFDTREVPTGTDTWELEASDKTLGDDTLIDFSDGARTLSQALSDMRANALLIIQDGKIVREIHRNGGNQNSRYAGYSMSKSWLSILVGLALHQGALDTLDDDVTKYVSELHGTAFEGVTLHDLLQMKAGTSWTESYAPGGDLDAVRDASINTAEAFYESAAQTVVRVAEPGTTFNYSTLTAEILGVALQRAVREPIADYMSEFLWQPAGMEAPGFWVLQGPSGNQHEWVGAGFGARLRDFGRLGQMMLDRGVANGKQVVPREWVNTSTNPEDNPNYFYLWRRPSGIDGFAARGFGGQLVMVDRKSRTVMVLARYTTGATTHGDPVEFFRSIIDRLQ